MSIHPDPTPPALTSTTPAADCANNGLTVFSSVVNGSGPATDLSYDVNSSAITGNRSHNLRVMNDTALTRLAGATQNTNLNNSTGANVALDQTGGTTQHTALDFGGGSLGSQGKNCVAGAALLDAETTGFTVFAQHNWWGSPAGPGEGRTAAVNGSILTSPFLTAKPPTC